MSATVVRVPGKTIPESASCDEGNCEWVSEDEKTIIKDARRHTLETGHDTVVWSYKAAWYSRRGTSRIRELIDADPVLSHLPER